MTKETGHARQPTDELIALLDAADTLPGATELRSRSYELLRIEPGTSVADVGCGAGRAVAELAERGARPVGVDPQERMIAVARERWPEGNFRIAGAQPCPAARRRVGGRLPRGQGVPRTGRPRESVGGGAARARAGRILLIGQDWDTFVIDSDDPALTRTIVHARADLTRGPRAAIETCCWMPASMR